MPTRLHPLSRALIAVGVLLALTRAVVAQTTVYPPARFPNFNVQLPAAQPASEFGLYWAVWPDNTSWPASIDVHNVPWRRELGMIYWSWFDNLYPRAGLHMIELYPGGPDAYYAALLTRLNTILGTWIPDPAWSGMICFDSEWFQPNYTGHWNLASSLPLDSRDDTDFIDDWKETLRQTRAATLATMNPVQQEEYFRTEYLATVRTFYTKLYTEMKRLRPNSKVGFYNIPTQMYWQWRDPAKAAQLRWAHDNEAAWFYQMVDVVFPSIYPIYVSQPAGTTVNRNYEDLHADYDRYLIDNITEAKRLAAGKPVYPFIALQYHPSNTPNSFRTVNDYNMRRSFEVPREQGCNGVVLWGWLRDQSMFVDWNTMSTQRLNPFLRSFAALPSLVPPPPPPPDPGNNNGNTGGGSSGNPNLGTPNTGVIPPVPPEHRADIDLPMIGGGNGSQGIGDIVISNPDTTVPTAPPSDAAPTSNIVQGGGGGGGGGISGAGGGGHQLAGGGATGASSTGAVMVFRNPTGSSFTGSNSASSGNNNGAITLMSSAPADSDTGVAIDAPTRDPLLGNNLDFPSAADFAMNILSPRDAVAMEFPAAPSVDPARVRSAAVAPDVVVTPASFAGAFGPIIDGSMTVVRPTLPGVRGSTMATRFMRPMLPVAPGTEVVLPRIEGVVTTAITAVPTP